MNSSENLIRTLEDISFIGDWHRDRILGSGSFGVVILWKKRDSYECLATKICKWSEELTARHRERWTKEVEMLQNCRHPNIVATKELPIAFLSVLTAFNPSNLPILSMEYCSGGDLRQLLNLPENVNGLSEDQVKRILGDVKKAIKFLHMHKIIHRDLKPENVVMQIDNTINPVISPINESNITYKLIDLGYAKQVDNTSVCGTFVGTMQYLAPELIAGQIYNSSVDYWSFGVLAYEIICGVRPFLPHMSPAQWMPILETKPSDTISIFEIIRGDMEFSDKIHPENHLSLRFRAAIEEWLKLALEWDPELRGKDITSRVTNDSPDAEQDQSYESLDLIIYSHLDKIINEKSVNIYLIPTMEELSYSFGANTKVAELKNLIVGDTRILKENQVLISSVTKIVLEDCMLLRDLWHFNKSKHYYLFDKSVFLRSDTEYFPQMTRNLLKARSMNSDTSTILCSQFYRCAFFFVYSLINGQNNVKEAMETQIEIFQKESKILLLKHNEVDKMIANLLVQQKTVSDLVNIGQRHIEELQNNRTGLNVLGGFQNIFCEYHDITNKVERIDNAWKQLTVTLQSSIKRMSQYPHEQLQIFFGQTSFKHIYSVAKAVYAAYKKNILRNINRAQDMENVIYHALRSRTKYFLDLPKQHFVVEFMHHMVEIPEINEAIKAAKENTEKLTTQLAKVTQDLYQSMWAALKTVVENNQELSHSVATLERQNLLMEVPSTSNATNSAAPTQSIVALYSQSPTDIRAIMAENLRLRRANIVLLLNIIANRLNISDPFNV